MADCTRALTWLNSCTWYLSPPSRNDMPGTKSALVTIAPAIDALTSMYSPARNAASAMTNSVRLPSVALSRPPTASPVLAATDSVARLSIAASGTIASTDSPKRSVGDASKRCSAANTTGTNTSNQRMGVSRMAFSS